MQLLQRMEKGRESERKRQREGERERGWRWLGGHGAKMEMPSKKKSGIKKALGERGRLILALKVDGVNMR